MFKYGKTIFVNNIKNEAHHFDSNLPVYNTGYGQGN